MKKSIFFTMALLLIGTIEAEAQIFKKLKRVAEEAVERTVEERVDRETTEKTDQVLDSILAPGKGKDKQSGDTTDEWGNEEYGVENGERYEGDESDYESSYPEAHGSPNGAVTNPSLEIYSKFDFVPGDKLLFYDDFAQEFIGDFPSKWNTNGSGELVSVGDTDQKWLEMRPGYNILYIPDVPALPEEYTIEFDLLAVGLDRQTSSTAVLKVGVSDNSTFNWGKYATVDIPFCQYAPVGFHVRNGIDINNNIQGDIREKVLDQPRISIAVNKQRFRLWVDESKYVDIPRMIPDRSQPRAVKFELHQFKDGKDRLFISNLKVAEGGVDLRRQLLADGKVSTNAILFESGSDQIRPQSMGVIRQIYQVLKQDKSLQLKIVGHTDADGDENTNMNLSLLRAEAVKNALISVYGIDGSRLQTQAMGETDPVADNNTAEGKALNRRVEFVRI